MTLGGGRHVWQGTAPSGFIASQFFVFPNRSATLQIDAPALGRPVPIEEYIFNLTGFIAVLLIYVWLDQFWLAVYDVPDYEGEARRTGRIRRGLGRVAARGEPGRS